MVKRQFVKSAFLPLLLVVYPGLFVGVKASAAETPSSAGAARPVPERASGNEITIKSSAITAGGVTSMGGEFSASSTTGQPVAGAMTGGEFTMTGGFSAQLVVQADPPTVGDNTCQTAGADTGTPCNTDTDCTSPAVCGLKSRYISVTPTNFTVAGGAPDTSIQVQIVSMPQFPSMVGDIYYAGPEQGIPSSPNPAQRGAPLLCQPIPSNAQVWTAGSLHLFGAAIIPGATYNIRMCYATGANCSEPVLVATGKWGDVVRPFGGGSQPNFADINSIVQKFSNLASAPATPRVDLVGAGNPGLPNVPNQVANFADISNDVSAFGGLPYPYTVPMCP